MSGITRTTTDPEVIRRWAEARGGGPARIEGTQRGGAGFLRIQFVDDPKTSNLTAVTWTEFFEKFEEAKLAFTYQEATSDGEISRFNRLVSRGDSAGSE